MSKCDNTSISIRKLRALREKLCGQEKEWQSAFEVRDLVVSQLIDIDEYCQLDAAKISVIQEKLSCLLEFLQIKPGKKESK